LNAFGLTVGAFIVPPVGQTVVVNVSDATFVAVGEMLYVDRAGGGIGLPGVFQVTAKSGNQLTLLNPPVPPGIPLADTTQPGMLTQVSGNTIDYIDGTNNCRNLGTAIQPTIWAARLRSFNSVGNPTFEVGQSDVGAVQTNPANNTHGADRWFISKAGMAGLSYSIQRNGTGAMGGASQVLLPGTNFTITNTFLRLTVNTAYASLAAGDLWWLNQFIEGQVFRELQNDVHSCSLLVRSSVAGLSFGLGLRDPATPTRSLTKLCTIPVANTWTLISLPNLPLWPSAGGFNSSSGQNGYQLSITLSSGATFMSPANDTWQNGNFTGALGQSNLAASNGATFDIAFIQHEPGPLCTTLIDKPFDSNLDECLRYYTKSYPYTSKAGTVGTPGCVNMYVPANLSCVTPIIFRKIMANVPTITGYSSATGLINAVRDTTAATDRGINSALTVADSGFTGFLCNSQNAGTAQYQFHWIADTGW